MLNFNREFFTIKTKLIGAIGVQTNSLPAFNEFQNLHHTENAPDLIVEETLPAKTVIMAPSAIKV